MSLKTLLAAGAIAALTATPVLAQEKSPEDLARDGLGKLLSALELFIGTIPQYETPEILPNGDIIIRRINPEERKQDEAEREKQEKRKDSI